MTLLSPSITRAAALTMTVDNFRLTESSMQARGFLRRDGLASVFPSATGLSQTVSWLESRRFAGLPNSDAAIEWSATFAPPQGVTITPGEPLPDGTYLLNGSFELWEGKRFAHFTVTTVEALEYSAECVAQVAAGMGGTPFMAGHRSPVRQERRHQRLRRGGLLVLQWRRDVRAWALSAKPATDAGRVRK
jgi:hypothetical protein